MFLSASARGLPISFDTLCCGCLLILPQELDLVVFIVYPFSDLCAIAVCRAFRCTRSSKCNCLLHLYNGLTYSTTPNGDDNEISKHQRSDLRDAMHQTRESADNRRQMQEEGGGQKSTSRQSVFHEDEQRQRTEAVNVSDCHCWEVGTDAGARAAPAAETCFYLRPENK